MEAVAHGRVWRDGDEVFDRVSAHDTAEEACDMVLALAGVLAGGEGRPCIWARVGGRPRKGASPSVPESRQGGGRSVGHPGSPALVGGPCAQSSRGAGGPGFWVGGSPGGGTHLWVPGRFPTARRAAVPMACTEVQALVRLWRGAGARVPCSKSLDRGAGAAEHPS